MAAKRQKRLDLDQDTATQVRDWMHEVWELDDSIEENMVRVKAHRDLIKQKVNRRAALLREIRQLDGGNQ